MAKGIVGPIMQNVSGSVGNVTFRQTRNGQVAQTKPVPTGDPTPAQTASREDFRLAFDLWRDMPQVLHDIAERYARRKKETVTQSWVKAYRSKDEDGAPLNLPYQFTFPVPLPDIVSNDNENDDLTIEFPPGTTYPDEHANAFVLEVPQDGSASAWLDVGIAVVSDDEITWSYTSIRTVIGAVAYYFASPVHPQISQIYYTEDIVPV